MLWEANFYIHTHTHTHTHTHLLTPWCRVLLEKLTRLQLVKNFPAFHGTRRFITALTSVRHLSLSWASPVQSIYPTSHLLEIRPNIIRPSTPRSPQWSLSLRFPHQDPISLKFTRITMQISFGEKLQTYIGYARGFDFSTNSVYNTSHSKKNSTRYYYKCA